MATKQRNVTTTSAKSAGTAPARKGSAAKGSPAKPRAAAKKTPAKVSTAAKKSPAGNSSAKSAAKAPAKTPTKAAGRRSASKTSSDTHKYTDPALRDRIKAKVMREGKGGRPGQWSARKAQMVAHEYETAGGKYKGGRDAEQKSLTSWGDEHWTTQDGKPARRSDGMHATFPRRHGKS